MDNSMPVIDNALTYFKNGNEKSAHQLYEDAIYDYTISIRLNPNLAEAYCNRGLAKKNLQNLAGAMIDVNKALEIAPSLANAYNCRGLVNWDLGNLNEALRDFSSSIHLNPILTVAFLNRGNAKSQLKSYIEAIPDYLEFIRLSPMDSRGHNNLGAAFAAINQHHNAIQAYTKAIKIDPNDKTAFTNRGLSREKIEQYDEAINDLTVAINLDKQYTDAYIYRGNTYQKINSLKNAIVDYCIAIPLSMSLLSEEQQYMCISKLLKFRKVNDDNLQAIKNCKVWFAHPDTFTDKQDGKYLLQLFPEQDAVRQALSSMLVYSCFGLSLDNECIHENISVNNENIMWAEYGASSKGICLHYQYTPEKALQSTQFSFDKVSYVSEINPDENISLYDTLQHGFFTKHTDFHFENECRFITVSRENDLKGQIVNEADLGLSLAAVDFGVECSQEDKQKVIDAINARANSESIHFYQLTHASAGSFKFKRTQLLR